MGDNQDPVTLHKYLYANVDPVNNIDPTGHFSLGSLMAGVNVRGVLSTIAQSSSRLISRVVSKGAKGFKKREWLIYRVKLGPHSLSHEFIWAQNRKTKRGIGYHVSAPLRDALRSARTGEFVLGSFAVLPQKNVNKVAGRNLNVVSKKLVGGLGKLGFAMWSASTVGNMAEGDSCSFSYNIPNSSCVTWSDKAEKKAKMLSLFPL